MGEYDARDDVYVTVCRLPTHVKGLIKEVHGDSIILISESLSDEAKEKVLRHELKHLRDKDIHSQRLAVEIENEASKI